MLSPELSSSGDGAVVIGGAVRNSQSAVVVIILAASDQSELIPARSSHLPAFILLPSPLSLHLPPLLPDWNALDCWEHSWQLLPGGACQTPLFPGLLEYIVTDPASIESSDLAVSVCSHLPHPSIHSVCIDRVCWLAETSGDCLCGPEGEPEPEPRYHCHLFA